MNHLYRCISLLLFLAIPVRARVAFTQPTYWRYQAFSDAEHAQPDTNTFWAYYTASSADKAFDQNGKKGSAQLAQIFFNKASFYGAQVYPPQVVSPAQINALFTPRLSYKQQGIDIGYHGAWRITKNWSWGLLAEVPISQVSVRSHQTVSASQDILFFGNPLSSVFQQQQATTGNQTYTTYAYRLDFLSQLPYACTGVGLEYPLTLYHDADFLNLPLTLSNVDTTNANNNPVTLLYAPPGSLPPQPYALTQSAALALPALAADGSQTGSNQRERTLSGVDYTALASLPANQEQWWVVPTLIPVSAGQTTVFPARVIRDHVNEVVGCFTAQAEDIFDQAGISFASQKSWGAGDLTTQLFVTYHDTSWWGLRMRGGIVFPTGKKVENVTNVYEQPVGSNGHYQLQLGAEFLIDVPHFSAMIYALESHAFRRKEHVPTAFLGSCIKNVGFCSSADISWDTLSAGLLVSLYPPSLYPSCVSAKAQSDILLGYNVRVKSDDRIHYKRSSAYGFSGTLQALDNQVLKQNSAQQAHIFQLQLRCALPYGVRLDGGVDYTFAGTTAPVICAWNIGLAALF